MEHWGKAEALYLKCAQHGLGVVEQEHEDGNVHFPDYREVIFGGRAACFVPYEKIIYVNRAGLVQYGDYPGMIHELGHAVWTLLLRPQDKWSIYHPLWARDREAGTLLNDYSASAVEEGWAEDFTWWWWDRFDEVAEDRRKAIVDSILQILES